MRASGTDATFEEMVDGCEQVEDTTDALGEMP